MNWLTQPVGGTIEVEITFKCNLKCRHCNRFCNIEKDYNLTRQKLDMNMEHIYYLCKEIMRFPKLRFHTLRIIGGEPLMSDILIETLNVFKNLVVDGFIRDIIIVTNGTFRADDELKPFIKLLPEKLNSIYRSKGYLTKKEVYEIKNIKHRNITIVPADLGLDGKLCDRVLLCGINYSIYGFTLCAPCLTPLILFPDNHAQFQYEIPGFFGDFISGEFEKEVCSRCSFCDMLPENSIMRNNDGFIGKTWQEQIAKNLFFKNEPDTSWINFIEKVK